MECLRVLGRPRLQGIPCPVVHPRPGWYPSQPRHLHSTPPCFKIIPFLLTDIGEGITQVEVIQWHVKEGDRVKQSDRVCDVASDKATVEITCRYDGVVTKLHCKQGGTAFVGKPLIDLEDGTAADPLGATSSPPPPPSPPVSVRPPAVAPQKAPDPASTFPPPSSPGKVLTTPAVRAIAVEHHLDLSAVPATGPHGRILKEDVLRYLKGEPHSPTPAPTMPLPAPRTMAEDRVEPLCVVRKAMFKAMTHSLTIPTFSCGDSVEVDALMALRKKCKALLQARSKDPIRPPPSLTFLPFIIKACSLALRQYPALNASVDAEALRLIYRARHNIGVAVDSPAGLVVPNVKDVQLKSIFQIAEELATLQELAQSNKLTPEHLQDGTFTLSNIGAIGANWAVPVVFPPQVAIGAISKVERLPRFDESGAVVPRHVMNFGWSADHRVIDGATMVKFSNLMLSYLRDPETMLLDL